MFTHNIIAKNDKKRILHGPFPNSLQLHVKVQHNATQVTPIYPLFLFYHSLGGCQAEKCNHTHPKGNLKWKSIEKQKNSFYRLLLLCKGCFSTFKIFSCLHFSMYKKRGKRKRMKIAYIYQRKIGFRLNNAYWRSFHNPHTNGWNIENYIQNFVSFEAIFSSSASILLFY